MSPDANASKDRKFIGAVNPGGIKGKKPSEMTDEELDAWADTMADAILNAIGEQEQE